MIIAGVFKKNLPLFNKLDLIVRGRIKKDISYFSHPLVDIVCGKTSDILYQGNIFKNKEILLAGKVFRKDDFTEFSLTDLNELLHINENLFSSHFWGSYLFIKAFENEKKITIVRDPVGQLPFFYTSLPNGEVIFSSEIDIILKILDKKPGFNWSYLSEYMISSSLTSQQTAFENIYELPHGCKLSIAQNSIIEELDWNPLNYCQGYKTGEDFQGKLIATLQNTIGCYTSQSEAIALDFSGGTDSTALLYIANEILSRSQPLFPVNVFHPEISSSDERKYAKKIVNGLGLDLKEIDISSVLPLDPPDKLSNVKPNWPTATLMHQRSRDINIFASNQHLNMTYMSGRGGDQVFLAVPPFASLADYFIQVGMSGIKAKFQELYRMYRIPLPQQLKLMFPDCFSYYLSSPNNKATLFRKHVDLIPFFKDEVYGLANNINYHPFFYQKEKVLPGKFKHISGIYRGLSAIKGDVRNNHTNPVFHPLYSQPIMELALSLPTYESFKNGYNRYQFRDAISRQYNTDLVWRKDKGSTSGILQLSLKKNAKYIQDLCLEGEAVKKGLIDKDLLSKNLKEMICGRTTYQWPIMNLISLEIFMDYWH